MAFNHGKASYVNLDDAGGSPTDISAYITGVSLPRSADVVDVTTLGDASKDYIGGLLDGTLSMEGKWDDTIDAILAAALGVAKTFIYGPAGSTGGYVKYTGEAIMTGYELESSLDGAVSFTAEFQVTGGVTVTTF